MREINCDPQYTGYCVEIEQGDTAEEVIEYAHEIDATWLEQIDEDKSELCFVVKFPGRFPELYSEKALRSGIRQMSS